MDSRGNDSENRKIKLTINSCAANLGAFLMLLAALGTLSAVLPKATYSEAEKRDLATKPKLTAQSYFSGDFSKGADAFFSDNFVFRDNLVALSAVLEEWRGVRLDDVKIHEVQPTPPPQVPEEVPIAPPGDDLETENFESPTTEAPERNGSVFIYKGKAMSIFGGSNNMAKWYADTINAYATALPEVQVYNAIIPTQIEFGLPARYKDVSSPQKPNIDFAYSSLLDSVKKVDAYGQLSKHKDEYIYFGTDHHWTVKGAYYAYVAFCEQAGFTPVPYDDFQWKRKDDFLGTLYSQTQDSTLKANPDFVDYPIISTPHTAYMYKKNMPFTPFESTIMAEYASGVNKYSVFLHGDQPLMEIQTNIKNGRKIAVVKESFGNAFVPFLANHYESIYVVDQRYFQLGLVNFIKEKGINELLFINNIFAANTPYHIKCINGLMYQQFVPPPPPPTVAEEAEPPLVEEIPPQIEEIPADEWD